MSKTLAAVAAICFAMVSQAYARSEEKIVTRIDDATAQRKGDKIIVHATGAAPTAASLMAQGAKLVRRGELVPNKDGFIDNELRFFPPRKPGDKLRPVKASISERLPAGEIKGARVFGELNSMDGVLAVPGEKKKK